MKKIFATLLFALVSFAVVSDVMACGCGGGAKPRPHNRTIASL